MRGYILIKKLVKDEDGIATIWFLLFIPILLMMSIYSTTQIQAVTGSDVDLQGAVNFACRSAAMQVNEASQAEDDPRINSDKAHEVFKKLLAENLNLYTDSLEPRQGSFLVQKPDYVFIVYNGNNDFSSSGALSYKKYIYENGSLATEIIPVSDINYGRNFYIIDSPGIDIKQNNNDGTQCLTTKLNSPGVVAIVDIEHKNLSGKQSLKITRWIAARINHNK